MSRGAIWSWQDRLGAWIEVNPEGSTELVDRMYGTARRLDMTGAAFVLLPPGQRPIGDPISMEVLVVGVDDQHAQPSPMAAAVSDVAWRAYFATEQPDEHPISAIRAALGATLRHLAGMQGTWTITDLNALATEFEQWANR